MKRIFASSAIVFGLFGGSAAQADVSFTSAGVTVKTCTNTAGAICSVKQGNKEFIDNIDHGRQLQTAITFGQGEAYNPTEAGSVYDGYTSNPSSSTLFAESANANSLSTWNRMAYWYPVNGAVQSNWYLNKTVTAYAGTYATYLKYDVTVQAMSFTDEPVHSYGQFETLTGYMPSSFSVFNTLDVKGTRVLGTPSPVYCSLASQQNGTCSPEQKYPLIFSEPGGAYAMGIYNRALPQSNYPDAGFGRWNFAATTGQPVVKWNAVFRYDTAKGDAPIQKGLGYSFTSYVVIGTLNNVKNQMLWLYDNGY